MEEKINEEARIPEWIQVDMTHYQNMEENLEYYKTAIRLIEESVEQMEETTAKKEMQDLINELKNNLK